jgi:CRISPR-associated endonuclease/helicase Cas3
MVEKKLPLDECLAKTVRLPNGATEKGVTVLTHCRIVGHVARELLSRQPSWLRSTLFPLGSDLVAACHDIGKISPSFQEKIHRALITPEFPEGIVLGLANPALDASIGGHASVSQAALADGPRFISDIVGRHHGYTSQAGFASDGAYGGEEWQRLREEAIELLKETFGAKWPEVASGVQADLLSGLTCVADWVGSGEAFDRIDQGEDIRGRVARALDLAGFVPPVVRPGLSFEAVFGFTPHTIQSAFVESVVGPGVYVLEAPMGMGKTEAALYAAYKMLSEGLATGIYFALPTQLTSERVYERVNGYLHMILDKNCRFRKALLLHGAAWLRQTHLGGKGEPGGSWFDSRKRGLIAPFAVGTIDQALMAAMNVKHGFVRTFGLAGKVVILDEVHSYDSYTGSLLDQLARILRDMQCTVIILSATLTAERRRELLGSQESNVARPYPLVSAAPSGGGERSIAVAASQSRGVHVRRIAVDEEALEESLLRAERGEQVLWIENTVDDAQKQFMRISARAGGMHLRCGLLHSRFLKKERAGNEELWVGLYGKGGGETRLTKGRILVGTQVLEQSLDIDADFLVTRLCPTDMLMQRIGRLWRHRGNDALRPKGARPEVWVLTPGLAQAVENPGLYGKTAMVYPPYVLCRTLEVMGDRVSIDLPDDIRTLLEATYADREETGRLAADKHELDTRREKLRRLAAIGIARDGKTLPESKASTRYSERESTEVLLVRSVRHGAGATRLVLLDGTDLNVPHKGRSVNARERRAIAATLLLNTVSVPEHLAPDCTRRTLVWLDDYVYLGDAEECPFRAAVVVDSGALRGLDQREPHERYRLRYDSTLGYVASRV